MSYTTGPKRMSAPPGTNQTTHKAKAGAGAGGIVGGATFILTALVMNWLGDSMPSIFASEEAHIAVSGIVGGIVGGAAAYWRVWVTPNLPLKVLAFLMLLPLAGCASAAERFSMPEDGLMAEIRDTARASGIAVNVDAAQALALFALAEIEIMFPQVRAVTDFASMPSDMRVRTRRWCQAAGFLADTIVVDIEGYRDITSADIDQLCSVADSYFARAGA